MTGEFKINVYFNEEGKELDNLISEIIINTLTKKFISWALHCRKMWDIILRDKFRNFSLGWKED